MTHSAYLFKMKLNIFLDTLIWKYCLYIMKNNDFWADLTDTSAKQKALVTHRSSISNASCLLFPTAENAPMVFALANSMFAVIP